jgi:hypothetical protein
VLLLVVTLVSVVLAVQSWKGKGDLGCLAV